MNMRGIVVERPGVVKIVDDIPMPEVGPYDALVRIDTCGFCNGTDTRIIGGQLTSVQKLAPFPTILGHEAAGVVLRVGDKVRNIAPGEKHIRIKDGDIGGDKYTATHAQMAEYGIVRDWAAMIADGLEVPDEAPRKPRRLPDDFDLIDAGVLLPLCECLSAVRNFDIGPETDVLVYGAGPMGLALMQYMKLVGAKSVTCVDSVPERLEKALTVAKVDRVINFQTEDAEAALGDRLFDRVLDAVGLSSILINGSFRLKPYGTLCSLGVLRKGDSAVDLSLIKNNTRIHMLNFPFGEFDVLEENLEYIKNGVVDPKNYYSHVMPFERVHDAIRLVEEKRTIKVILTFNRK